ncbi:uncharacterized protein LOC116338267 [Contarinia nasturtii]|uniref:uncharacterized protein LOC116338267 n=1 Tax=Contarinia nasturtii TaxID=265458 RepID=UPI0012D44C55|nr:uncharacterized protein LOC116338267 [Contarinia nasturtii]
MNLFIWNDYEWRLIKDSDEYDKKSFFVVRKLFVQWPKEGDAMTCNKIIREHYEAYGDIEFVEVVNEESPFDIHEAYVTFARSEDAYYAFMAGRRGTKAIQLLPADTWRQPGVELRLPEQIKAKNDDFECEDITVSELINDETHMCKCATVVPTIHLRQPMGLKSVLECFKPMKERVEHVNIVFDFVPTDMYINCLTDREYVKRAIQVISKIIGDRFNELTITKADTITLELLDALAPMLKLTETLTLEIENNASVLYVLVDYCPNLIDLVMTSKTWSGECSDAIARHWPSIVRLVIEGQLNIGGDTNDNAKLQQFIELNSQLEQIELNTLININVIRSIAEHCKDVYSLATVHANYNDIDAIVDLLAQMKHLSSVKLSFLKVQMDELNVLATCAERFSKMKQLKLVTLFQNLEPPQNQQFLRLFTYSVKVHDGCSCHGPNVRKLQLGGINKMLDLPENRPVFATFINTFNLKDNNADMDLLVAPIIAFEKAKKFFPNIVDGTPIIINDEDNSLCIHVSYA